MGKKTTKKPSAKMFEVTNENFYEIAWNVRLQVIESLISEGETNPYRIIKKMESWERRYELVLDKVTMYSPTSDGNRGDVLAQGYSGNAHWTPAQHERFEALPTGVVSFWESSLRGAELVVPAYTDIAGIPAKWVVDLCREDHDCIVELGSGLGRNIFEIYFNGGPAKATYFAGEFTESGRSVTEKLASLIPELDIRACAFDHRKPDFSFLNGHRSVLMFTCHSIEQVDRIPDDYFETLAGAAENVTCIHFEPFGFQISTNNPISKSQQNLAHDKNWNTNFVEVLEQSRASKKINVVFMATDLFAIDKISPTSVAIWQNEAVSA
jgi:hypothetical protein